MRISRTSIFWMSLQITIDFICLLTFVFVFVCVSVGCDFHLQWSWSLCVHSFTLIWASLSVHTLNFVSYSAFASSLFCLQIKGTDLICWDTNSIRKKFMILAHIKWGGGGSSGSNKSNQEFRNKKWNNARAHGTMWKCYNWINIAVKKVE